MIIECQSPEYGMFRRTLSVQLIIMMYDVKRFQTIKLTDHLDRFVQMHGLVEKTRGVYDF